MRLLKPRNMKTTRWPTKCRNSVSWQTKCNTRFIPLRPHWICGQNRCKPYTVYKACTRMSTGQCNCSTLNDMDDTISTFLRKGLQSQSGCQRRSVLPSISWRIVTLQRSADKHRRTIHSQVHGIWHIPRDTARIPALHDSNQTWLTFITYVT